MSTYKISVPKEITIRQNRHCMTLVLSLEAWLQKKGSGLLFPVRRSMEAIPAGRKPNKGAGFGQDGILR